MEYDARNFRRRCHHVVSPNNRGLLKLIILALRGLQPRRYDRYIFLKFAFEGAWGSMRLCGGNKNKHISAYEPAHRKSTLRRLCHEGGEREWCILSSEVGPAIHGCLDPLESLSVQMKYGHWPLACTFRVEA